MRNNYYCILDIGSRKITAILAEIKNDKVRRIYHEKSFFDYDIIKAGTVLDTTVFLKKLDQVLEKLEKESGIYISDLYVNIPANQIMIRNIQSKIVLNEGLTKIVGLADLKNIKRQAELLGTELEEIVLESIPLSYSLDNQEGISNPLGLYGHKLGINLRLVCAKANYINNLKSLLGNIGRTLKKVYFPLKTSYYAINFGRNSKGMEVVCDIGDSLTQIAIFRCGIISAVEFLNLAGRELTEEIMHRFDLDWQAAEDLKISHAQVMFDNKRQDREVLVNKKQMYVSLSQNLVNQMITQKLKYFCQELKKKLKDNIRLNEINNFYVLGRTSFLEGFLELLETELSVPVRLAYVSQEVYAYLPELRISIEDNILDYLCNLGMLLELVAPKTADDIFLNGKYLETKSLLKRIFYRVKEIYQEYF